MTHNFSCPPYYISSHDNQQNLYLGCINNTNNWITPKRQKNLIVHKILFRSQDLTLKLDQFVKI